MKGFSPVGGIQGHNLTQSHTISNNLTQSQTISRSSPVGGIQGHNLSPASHHKWFWTSSHLRREKFNQNIPSIWRQRMLMTTWLHANTWIEISWSSAGRRMVTPSTLSYCDKMIQNTSKYPPLHKIVILQLHLPRYGWGRKSSRLAIQSQVGTHVASRVRWRRDNDRRLQHHQPYNLAISGNLWQSLAISGNLWQSLAIQDILTSLQGPQ